MKLRQNIIIGLLLITVLTITGCLRSTTPIRIGTNAWPPCEIWQIAEEQGFFGQTPVEIVRFSNWSDNMSSLYKGNVDITHATYFNAVYYHDKGEAGKIILSSDYILGSDGLVVKNSIVRGEDLIGKTIAVEINTDEHFLLKKALEEYGLTEEDVILRSTTSIAAMELFIAGEVDACFTYDPFLRQAAEKGAGKIIWTTEALPGYMVDVLVAREETIRNRHKDLETILAAWFQAQEYISSNSREVFPQMADVENMATESFAGFYNSFTFLTAEENRAIFASSLFYNKLEEMNEFLLQHGAIKSKADVGELFTADIVKGLK